MTDWCILRCSGGSTLGLAGSLTEAGFEVWAPAGPTIERTGPQRTRKEIPTALMPGWVFARADRLHDLLALAHAPSLLFQVWDREERRMVTKGHPQFSVFRGGSHRFIADAELSALRRAERRPRAKPSERKFQIGDLVRTDDGGFGGLIGTVVGVTGKMVQVSFLSWAISPSVASYLLRPAIDEKPEVNVETRLSEQAQSAKAA